MKQISLDMVLPYYIGGSDDLNFGKTKGKMIADSGMYNPSEIVESGIDGTINAPFFSLFISVFDEAF